MHDQSWLNKVKSVMEFQGEKYINSKIILFCGVIEFLINHSLIANKTSHNLLIWNQRLNGYFWMFPIVVYCISWINKGWILKLLSRRFCFYYCINLERQEANSSPFGPSSTDGTSPNCRVSQKRIPMGKLISELMSFIYSQFKFKKNY